ncbi:hypothetical protein N7488_002354 [Penicillium malachiteum]|nr:hypothetical protein N7488_002354 [Penicillium malachiteum]
MQSFCSEVVVAIAVYTILTLIIAMKLPKTPQINSGYTEYPPYVTCTEAVRRNRQLPEGLLDPKNSKATPLLLARFQRLIFGTEPGHLRGRLLAKMGQLSTQFL